MVEDLTWVRRLASTGGARALRMGAGLSLREVADELGVSAAAVSRWERGLRRPGGRLALKWGRLLRSLT